MNVAHFIGNCERPFCKFDLSEIKLVIQSLYWLRLMLSLTNGGTSRNDDNNKNLFYGIRSKGFGVKMKVC